MSARIFLAMASFRQQLQTTDAPSTGGSPRLLKNAKAETI
jgi:hypothetical protein